MSDPDNNTINVFKYNYANNEGGSIYLANLTEASTVKYIDLGVYDPSTGDPQKNELAIKDSTAKVTLANSKIHNNKNGLADQKNYSTIYVNNAELELDAGANIKTLSLV